MWGLRVWSMTVAVCSAHQPITLLWGAFITCHSVRLMKSEKWLPLISIHWPLQIAMIGNASYLSPSVKTNVSTNRIWESAASSHSVNLVFEGLCAGWCTVCVFSREVTAGGKYTAWMSIWRVVRIKKMKVFLHLQSRTWVSNGSIWVDSTDRRLIAL